MPSKLMEDLDEMRIETFRLRTENKLLRKALSEMKGKLVAAYATTKDLERYNNLMSAISDNYK